MENLFKIMDVLENIEKENGKLGTILGLLLIVVSTITTLFLIVALAWANIMFINWVVNQLWFK